LLEERGISVQFDSSIRFHIDSVLEKIKFAAPEGEQARKRSLDGDAICVKFLLIRWDQLPELAFNLSVSVSTGGTIGVAQLRQALERVADPNLAELKPYSDYLRASQMGRMGIPVTWRLAPQDGASVPTGHPGIVSENGGTWIDSFGSEMPVVAGCDVSPDPVNCGVLILRRVS
jgi:hypothetical protein